MDLQHKLAEQIAVWMDPDKEEENQEENTLRVILCALYLQPLPAI